MSTQDSESITPIFILGLFEAAINKGLAQNAYAMQTIVAYAGKVIRVKISSPYYTFYIMLCEDGVQLLSQFDGFVDSRIKILASQLLLLLWNDDSDSDFLNQLKITGEASPVLALIQLVIQLNARNWIATSFNQYLPDYQEALKKLNQLWPGIQSTQNVQQLALLVNETLLEIRQQSHAQQILLEELIQLRRQMEKNSSHSPGKLWFGLTVMLIVWFMAVQFPDITWLNLHWLLAMAGLDNLWQS